MFLENNLTCHPLASFEYSSDTYCHGEIDVTFSNTSLYETDSISWNWTFADVIDSINFDFSGDIDSADMYTLQLFITDGRGCTDLFINDSIYIGELDQIVDVPILNYVTWSDSGLVIVWNETQDDNFENLEIFHQANNFEYWLSVVDNIDYL